VQNLPTKLRPREVSDWIRSKKKSAVPSLNVGSYGKLFKEWWMMMQPAWRNKGGPLVRDVLQGETWQTLKKGGSAGIYVVIIALSWWVKAEYSEHNKHEIDVWMLVDDLSWVIQQMRKGMVSIEPEPVSKKRAHDDNAENLRRKT
jgi:hypothetical protein